MFALTLTPYERRHRQAVLDLIDTTTLYHTHLDWYSIDQWLDTQAGLVVLAWQGRRLAGMMGLSVPMGNTTWIRLLAVRYDAPTREILRALWEDALKTLHVMNVRSVALLIAQDWLAYYTPQFNMNLVETIVTLKRSGGDLPQKRNNTPILRPAELEDIDAMAAIDQAAFIPPWQLTAHDLRAAFRMASSCKVSYLDGEMVAYQLSTRHGENGHLARLAVLPQVQGIGVGGTLLHELIRGFMTRGVRTITVNTQLSNIRSQRLYGYYGFRRNGFDLPVWSVNL